MNIQTLTGNRLSKLVNKNIAQRLTPGQIVEGSILKIYPNNKAQIRLSTSQTLLAQLEASLSIGERYHFQVEANDQVLHLKVLGGALTHQTKQNVESLLKHFGIKTSRFNIDFVHTLIHERIPFDKNQLNRGLQFLNLAEQRPEALQAVKQMMTLKAPMTESIFHAFYHKHMNQLSPLMTDLFRMLKQEPTPTSSQQHLQSILGKMIETPSNQSFQMLENESVRTNNDTSKSQSIRYIQELIRNNEDFLRIKEEINRRIIPTLPSEWQQRVLSNLQTNTVHSQELFAILEKLKTEIQNPKFMMPSAQSRSIPLPLLKEQLITLINDYLQFIGTTEESSLKEGRQPPLSLKAYLLQMIQQESDVTFKQQAQTLVHTLNGVQLQSINDNQYFIQASLQIPGEKFALNEDMFIDFESKKTPDGKVDADHARILFYLNLRHLNETVIDMQIQKRHVTLALYNDNKSIKKKVLTLQPLLEDRLKSLNYHLTNVSVKPLKQTKQTKGQLPYTNPLFQQEGFDFRV